MTTSAPKFEIIARFFCALIIAIATNLTAMEQAHARAPKKQKQKKLQQKQKQQRISLLQQICNRYKISI